MSYIEATYHYIHYLQAEMRLKGISRKKKSAEALAYLDKMMHRRLSQLCPSQCVKIIRTIDRWPDLP